MGMGAVWAQAGAAKLRYFPPCQPPAQQGRMSYLLGAEATDPAAAVYGPPRWTTIRLEFSEEHCILLESSASQALL